MKCPLGHEHVSCEVCKDMVKEHNAEHGLLQHKLEAHWCDTCQQWFNEQTGFYNKEFAKRQQATL